MASSALGIYVGEHLIKYAKLTQDGEKIVVNTYGIKVYNDLNQTVKQIVNENVSAGDIVYVNLPQESYNYFYMSNLLNKNDLTKAVETEFESFCYDKNININTLESRYVFVNDLNDKEKIKVIHVTVNKLRINEIIDKFDGVSVSGLTPISMAIANLGNYPDKDNVAIVNIEDQTTITIITDKKVYDVIKLEMGAKQILDPISTTENSYAKAYGICKNTTIYTMDKTAENTSDNPYLADMIPTLYKIASDVQSVIQSEGLKFSKVYISGTGAIINNVDLYFSEVIGGKLEVEILKPFFADPNKDNVKDMVEVNSAISMALQGLGYGVKEVNFLSGLDMKSKFKKLLSFEIGGGGAKKSKAAKAKGKGNKLNLNIKNPLESILNTDKAKGMMSNVLAQALTVLFLYIIVVSVMRYSISSKEQQIAMTDGNTKTQIMSIQQDITRIKAKSDTYKTLTDNLNESKSIVSERARMKNKIPTLLNNIMAVIPRDVRLISIDNPSEQKIVIVCESRHYEQLAIFKTVLKRDNILTDISSTDAVKESDESMSQVTIEGVLP